MHIKTWNKSLDIKCSIFAFYRAIIVNMGPVAQVAEHLPFKQRVDGSSPSWLRQEIRRVNGTGYKSKPRAA